MEIKMKNYTPDAIDGSQKILSVSEIEERKDYLEIDMSFDDDVNVIEDTAINDIADIEEYKRINELLDMNYDTFIRDTYFKEYIQDKFKSMYSIIKELPNVLMYNIDWQGVADDCQSDYDSTEINGVTYWCE